jgi:hypothetical protein
MNKVINFKSDRFFKSEKMSKFGYVPAIGQILRFTDNNVNRTFEVKSIYSPVPGNFIQVDMEEK